MRVETDSLMPPGGEKEMPLTSETIDGYLDYLRSLGRVKGTIENYRRKLRRLYQTAQDGIERSIALLVGRVQDKLLEEEQMTVGWDV